MAVITICQHTFQNVTAYEEAVEDLESLKVEVQEAYSEIAKTSQEIYMHVDETFATRTDLEMIQADFQSSITETSSEIRFDFSQSTKLIEDQVIANQELLEEYIRFKGSLIELGKIGNAFTAELSNESLVFKEDGVPIAYISNQSLVITNAEIHNMLSLGDPERGWFDFLPRESGNLSIVWRSAS